MPQPGIKTKGCRDKKVKTKLFIIFVIIFTTNFVFTAQNIKPTAQQGADNETGSARTEQIKNNQNPKAQEESQTQSENNAEEEKYFSEKTTLKTRFGGEIETGVFVTHEAITKRVTIGSLNEIRLHAEVKYGTLFKVYVEPMFRGYYGARNNYYLFSRYGIFTQEQTDTYENLQALGINTDEKLNIDRGWAQIYTGFFKIRAGKQIIAWARAYSFNPTDKINVPNPLDPTALNLGVTGITYEMRIFEDFNANRAMFITGYFVLTDKLAKNTPFAVKTRFNLGVTEFAFSYIYEAKEDALSPGGYRRKSYLGFDFFTQALGMGFYIETTYRFEQKKDRDFESQLTAVAGISTTFSFKMSARVEYIYYGRGKTKKNEYEPARVISMSQYFMARHYVFLMFDGDAGQIVWLGLSGIINAVDLSVTIIPQIKLSVIENVVVEIGAFIFLGAEDSEMNGRFTVTDIKTMTPKNVDLTETQIYAKLKVSF